MEADIKILILKIVNKAMLVSNNTKADVFVNYSSHINNLTVFYYIDGWDKDEDFNYYEEIYIDKQTREETIAKLRNILLELQNLQYSQESLEASVYEEQ